MFSDPESLFGQPVQIAVTGQVEQVENEDHVFNYGLQVMQMGMFFIQLDDTERKGDGERIMRNWKMLMLYARCSGR